MHRIPGIIRRLGKNGADFIGGDLPLRDAVFNARWYGHDGATSGGLEAILRGLVLSPFEEIDEVIDDSLRNFLGGTPSTTSTGGSDLAARNIQRGRDHGLPDINTARAAYGLPPYGSFEELLGMSAGLDGATNDRDPATELRLRRKSILLGRLKTLFPGGVTDMDLYSAGLLEKYNGTSRRHLGATFQNIVREQFELIRDGDRFFYDQDDVLHEDTRELIKEMSLWDVIKRNADVSDVYVSNAFTMADPATCSAERKEGTVSVEKGKKMLQSGSEVAWKVVSSDTVCFRFTFLGTDKFIGLGWGGNKMIGSRMIIAHLDRSKETSIRAQYYFSKTFGTPSRDDATKGWTDDVELEAFEGECQFGEPSANVKIVKRKLAKSPTNDLDKAFPDMLTCSGSTATSCELIYAHASKFGFHHSNRGRINTMGGSSVDIGLTHSKLVHGIM